MPGQDTAELAATIRRYAELCARPDASGYRPKVAFVSSMGVNQSTGSYGFSTNLNLLLLTGNVGRKGAGSMRIAGQSNATSELMMGFNGRKLVFNHDPAEETHRQALSDILGIPVENIPDHKGTPVSQMSEDDRICCFIFVGTQMTKNMPRVGHWTRRMGRSFNIVIDSFLGEGVLEHADVLLPSMTYVERTGVIQRGDRTLQLQQQLSVPPENAWADAEILARLAVKIAERLRNRDKIMPDRVFDHLVQVSRDLDLYCRLHNAEGEAISHDMLRANADMGVQWGGDGRYSTDQDEGAVFPGLQGQEKTRASCTRSCPTSSAASRSPVQAMCRRISWASRPPTSARRCLSIPAPSAIARC
ncbi:MAG: molybdopterin-dependent oxidoreductase [Minwuia sp.]|nr:molybdopterin-dependent oxidoreductase [Minwuia sp.]